MSHNNCPPDDSSAQPTAYDVGYGKPPKTTQFKKGQSGNPKGRVKKSPVQDLRLLLDGILAEEVHVREGGRVRKMTNLESLLHIQMTNALKGSKPAVRALIKHARKAGFFTRLDRYEGLGRAVEKPLAGDHGKILRLYRAEKAAAATSSPKPPT
jgi:hypothetical protein